MNYLQLPILFGFLLMSTAGFAQPNKLQPRFPKHTQGDRVQKEVEGLRIKLELTEGQIQEVTAIEKMAYGGYVALLNEGVLGVARKEKLQQLQKVKEEALIKVLTSAQWESYVSYMEERRQKAKQEMEQRRRELQMANNKNGQ